VTHVRNIVELFVAQGIGHRAPDRTTAGTVTCQSCNSAGWLELRETLGIVAPV
jgi:hypothetical protein